MIITPAPELPANETVSALGGDAQDTTTDLGWTRGELAGPALFALATGAVRVPTA